MKKIAILSFLSIINYSFTQSVGVQTDNPTETFDVNGTTRVRSLPLQNNTISTATDGTKGNGNFTPTVFVLTNENGVLGVSGAGKKISASASDEDFNNATSIFVVKRYRFENNWDQIDNNGDGGSKTVSTGMSVDKWEAVLAPHYLNYKILAGTKPFDKEGEWGVELIEEGGIWKLRGNVSRLRAMYTMNILFIKKGFASVSEGIIVR